jgi:hypothetical protein
MHTTTSNIVRFVTLAAAAAACSQITGLSDYEIDSSLGDAGDPSRAGAGSILGGAGAILGGAGGETVEPPNGGVPGGAGEPATGGTDAGGQGGSGPNLITIPCDSEDCCADEGGEPLGVELLKDGGFEAGPVDDGNMNWKESSTVGVPLISDGFGELSPRNGVYLAWLGGLLNELSDLQSHNIVVPDDAGWMVLTGYRLFQIDDFTQQNQDFCGIGLYDPQESDPIELPFFWDRTDPNFGSTDSAWERFEAAWDAAPHAGETRYLLLRGSVDGLSTDDVIVSSNYVFDQLSLKAFRCVKEAP